MEWLRLRAQDIDFDFKNIRIWNDKGGKHRIVAPSEDLVIPLRSQIQLVNHYLSLDRSSKAFAGYTCPWVCATKRRIATLQLRGAIFFLLKHSQPTHNQN